MVSELMIAQLLRELNVGWRVVFVFEKDALGIGLIDPEKNELNIFGEPFYLDELEIAVENCIAISHGRKPPYTSKEEK